jgi:hypothetical protein
LPEKNTEGKANLSLMLMYREFDNQTPYFVVRCNKKKELSGYEKK